MLFLIYCSLRPVLICVTSAVSSLTLHDKFDFWCVLQLTLCFFPLAALKCSTVTLWDCPPEQRPDVAGPEQCRARPPACHSREVCLHLCSCCLFLLTLCDALPLSLLGKCFSCGDWVPGKYLGWVRRQESLLIWSQPLVMPFGDLRGKDVLMNKSHFCVGLWDGTVTS